MVCVWGGEGDPQCIGSIENDAYVIRSRLATVIPNEELEVIEMRSFFSGAHRLFVEEMGISNAVRTIGMIGII